MTAQTQSKKSNIFVVSLSFFFLLVLGNIFFSVRTLQAGLEMGALEQEKATILKETTQLEEQLNKRESLSEVAAIAEAEGFEPITETVAITVPSDSSVALR